MTQSLRTGILLAIIVLLIAGLVYQEHRVSSKGGETDIIRDSLEREQLFSGSLQRHIKDIEGETIELKEKNGALQDTIVQLKRRIFKLNEILQNQGKTILNNERKIKELQERAEKLLDEANRLRNSGSASTATIAKLENERLELGKNIANLNLQNENLRDSVVASTVEKEELKENVVIQNQIVDVTKNLKVEFKSVETKKEGGNRSTRPSTWKSTVINLNFDYPNLEALKGEYFMIQIYDMDNKKVVSPREGNSSEGDTQGIMFRFDGNPIAPIIYDNYQKKEGKNYAVKVFFIKNNGLYALNNGGLHQIDF